MSKRDRCSSSRRLRAGHAADIPLQSEQGRATHHARREGHYLLRSNLKGESPEKLWQFYIQLTEVEQAFKELKNDLSIRPIYHQKDERIEAHIFVAFAAYCLQTTLKQRLRMLAPGLTAREVLEKFADMQIVDVHLPTTDGRHMIFSRYTDPDADQQLLLARLKMTLPKQPRPRIAPAAAITPAPQHRPRCSADPQLGLSMNQGLGATLGSS